MPIHDIEIEKKALAKEYKELLRISYQSLSKDDKKLIRKAFDYAVDAHQHQRRKSGEAYIFHPIAVAKIVASEIGLDAVSIASALIHDVVEDNNDHTLERIQKEFGDKIAKIVDGLTKIGKLNTKGYSDVSIQAENYRKMLLTLNEDVRVIIIKIADRLHNMQTLGSMPYEKQIQKASETLYIYAPLAHRIGLYNIKTELEDLGLKYTDPDTYDEISKKLIESKKDQDEYIDKFNSIISSTLTKEKLKYNIKGRTKSIFSINNKMIRQGISFEEVYDKFAVRIVYKSKPEKEKFIAWKIYSIITDNFTPNPTRLRDWISAPKSTGYEALHITVVGPKSKWVEVQIRSERMDEIAEKGYAAHYKYKQKDDTNDNLDSWINKLQEALENSETNAVDFVEQFKLNLYSKEIFVFTPTGDLKSLPKGATPLDFAFAIHTEVGLKTRGAKVNGKLVPLSHILKSGDQVDIMTSENVKPTVNWLDFVVTSKAKSKIKSSLNIEKKIIAIEGKQILKRKLKQFKIKLDDKISGYMMKFFKINASNDLFYDVGIGKIDNKQIKRFVSDYNSSFIGFIRRRIGSNNKKVDKINEIEHSIKFDKLIFGKDQELLKYSMANCCEPIPGDPVFGFVSVNDGIKVHKKDCPNSISLRSNYAYRIISAKWIDSQSHEFNTKISLTGIDDIGIISQIAATVSDSMNVNMNKLSFESNDGVFTGTISLEVKNKVILNKLLKSLKKIDGIDNVSRN